MKCSLVGDKARVLAKFLQFLTKIGPDLYIEAVDDGLILGTANSSNSGFARVHLWPSFFMEYEVLPEEIASGENYCRVALKACAAIFKSMKNVDTCNIRMKQSSGKLIIQLHCRQDTTKTHYISILEHETLSAPSRHNDRGALSTLTASQKVFADILTVFSTAEEELTIDATKSKISIKNYLEALHVNRQQMRTELSLNPVEFDTYVVDTETSLTFCLKEWRAFLVLAESLNSIITIHFETTGLPIEFSIQDLDIYQVTLFMSTLSNDLDSSRNISGIPFENGASQTAKNSKRVHEENVDEELNVLLKKPKGRTKRAPSPVSRIHESNPDIEDYTNNESGSEASSSAGHQNDRLTVARNGGNMLELPSLSSGCVSPVSHRAGATSPVAAAAPEQPNDLEVIFIRDTEDDNTLSNMPIDGNRECPSSLETLHGSMAHDGLGVADVGSGGKRKKTISLFRRCYEPSLLLNNMTAFNNVLADNSDSEGGE